MQLEKVDSNCWLIRTDYLYCAVVLPSRMGHQLIIFRFTYADALLYETPFVTIQNEIFSTEYWTSQDPYDFAEEILTAYTSCNLEFPLPLVYGFGGQIQNENVRISWTKKNH